MKRIAQLIATAGPRGLLLGICLGSTLLHAQSPNSNGNGASNANKSVEDNGSTSKKEDAILADRVWDLVKDFGRFDSPTAGGAPINLLASDREQADRYLGQANQLRAFYVQFPSHKSVSDARRLEALCLGWAALSGNRSEDKRRLQLVELVRNEKGFAADKRYEVAALNARVNLFQRKFASQSAYQQAEETAARSLVDDYPTLSEPYQLLLGVAENIGPDRGRVIAGDLAKTGAPGGIQNDARVLLERYDLIGKPLTSVLSQAGAAGFGGGANGKSTVVYTWSGSDVVSLRTAKQLEWATVQAAVVGINLDEDTATARQTASKHKLAGDHYYDNAGKNGRLAAALKINRAGLVYLVDKGGIIRDVQGLERIREKLAQFDQ